jgi:hypothetical protein
MRLNDYKTYLTGKILAYAWDLDRMGKRPFWFRLLAPVALAFFLDGL